MEKGSAQCDGDCWGCMQTVVGLGCQVRCLLSEPLNCNSTRVASDCLTDGIANLFVPVHVPIHLAMVKCGGSHF
jgi:hypothetical protein